MSHQCPRCHGHNFAAARMEGAEGLALVLEDGRRAQLEALLCSDCGRVELVAAKARTEKPGKPDDEIQQYDF